MKVKKSQIAMLAAAVFGVVAILMLLMSGVGYTLKGADEAEKVGTGFELMFGTQDGMKFNFMMFLPFLLVIVGIVGVVLSFLLKGKIGKFIALAAFAVAGILFFCFSAFMSMSFADQEVLGKVVMTGSDLYKASTELGSYSLGVGAILAGIFSLIAAAGAALGTFLFKK